MLPDIVQGDAAPPDGKCKADKARADHAAESTGEERTAGLIYRFAHQAPGGRPRHDQSSMGREDTSAPQ